MKRKVLIIAAALAMAVPAMGAGEAGKGYWIGVYCRPPSGALRAQLGLPDEGGLVVERVVPGSPAAEAGLERYDILLGAGDVKLKQVPDLGKAVAESGGRKMKFKLIRGGKTKSIAITPHERPGRPRFRVPERPEKPEPPKEPEKKPDRDTGFWIGIMCDVAEEGPGLVVAEVLPDTPAAKAGLKEGDILVRAGGRKLKEVADLVGAIQKTRGRRLWLDTLREGKKRKVRIEPARRPDKLGPGEFKIPDLRDKEQLEKWLEQFQKGRKGKGTFQWQFIHPPKVLPPGEKKSPALPDNMSVAVTKEGDKPARIVVRRAGEKWEVSEDELDELPDDIRPHIERMLGGLHVEGKGARARVFSFVPEIDFDIRKQIEKQKEENRKRMEEARKRAEKFQRHRDENIERGLNKRIEEMERQIEQLQKMIRQLQRSNER